MLNEGVYHLCLVRTITISLTSSLTNVKRYKKNIYHLVRIIIFKS